MHCAFRQLPEQSGEPGSNQDGHLGATELGRDDGWLLQPGLRSTNSSQRFAAGKEGGCEQQDFKRGSLTLTTRRELGDYRFRGLRQGLLLLLCQPGVDSINTAS